MRDPTDESNKIRLVWYTDDEGGFGREIVREVALCAACAAEAAEEDEHPRRHARGPPRLWPLCGPFKIRRGRPILVRGVCMKALALGIVYVAAMGAAMAKDSSKKDLVFVGKV